MALSHIGQTPLLSFGKVLVSSLLLLMPATVAAVASEGGENAKEVPILNLSSKYLPTESKLNAIEDTPIKEIKENFASPGTDFATGPLWVWNDLLTENQIRSTLADLNAQHVNQAFVHPRPGLATPYLSDEWFKLWDVALDEAQKRGMKIWIYDENSYPSGFAGGYVPDAMPESRGSGLDVVFCDELVDSNGNWTAGDSVVYVVEMKSDQKTTIDRTAEILEAKAAGKPVPVKSEASSRWIVGRKSLAGSSQWYGGKTYVNLLTSGVLEQFLGFTHEAYRSHYGDLFGKLIPGSFTDEPQVAPAGMLSWTDDFAEEFRKRNDYDIVPNIGALIGPVGEWKKVRYDYYSTVLDLLIERWHKPYAQYCENVGLQYTGHDWEHEWPGVRNVPDSMATAFWRQRPTIDLLMNQFSRNMNSQFGNVRSVRELNSVVHQAGRSRALSESYGAGGYDIRFADLKRLGDWSYALGVNMTDEHLSYISIRGARKHDHPQTFSYHSPWFEQYSKLEDYWTRLSYILSRGQLSSERFLLIEPTSTVWLYQHFANGEEKKREQIGVAFTNLVNKLEEEQVDYDLGSEDVVKRIGSVHEGKFHVGAASYKTVVLPPGLENLDEKTVQLLASFAQSGGRIVSLDARFSLVGGRAVSDLEISQNRVKTACDVVQKATVAKTVDELVKESRKTQPIVLLPSSNATNVFHQTRETKDALILFVCNIDLEEKATGRFALNSEWQNATVEAFDPSSGAISPYQGVAFSLGPCESATFVVSKSGTTRARNESNKDPMTLTSQDLISADKLTSIKELDDNVLVLDYMTLKLKDETIVDDYFYRVNNRFWNNKGFPKSPWDNGVQFKDELITQKFEDESGFELTYKFTKSDVVVDNLRFVVENPALFDAVYCNDQKVDLIPNAWKFDRSFGVFDISKASREGVNEIKLVADKSTLFCEFMPAWIVGAFALESDAQGFKIVANQELQLGRLAEDDPRLLRASSELEGVSWLNAGVGFCDQKDLAPFISYQFGEDASIDALLIWNYCEANLSKRGVKDVELTVLDENDKIVEIPGVSPSQLQFTQGDGSSQTIELAQTLELKANWKLTLTIKSNWNGISYPLSDDFVGEPSKNDNAFVGLAEVQFLTRKTAQEFVKLEKTPAVSASSELVYRMHNRRALFTVDGSGLYTTEFGWAAQGRPFYAGKVDYNFAVPVSELAQDRPVQFQLSAWNGAVAAILIDGKQIGAIGWKDESVDLSTSIKDAVAHNKDVLELTVRVYGTPKNLFGPHHAGKLRGSAWPGSFHSAPQRQPRGSAYDVIEYGLFAK